MYRKQSIPTQSATSYTQLPTPQSSTMTKEAKQRLTFLTLPVEIRLQVYELLFMKGRLFNMGRYKYFSTLLVGEKQTIQCQTEGAILQTCKQIHEEATPICYSQTEFSIDDPGQMLEFMKQIGPTNIKFVTSLWIRVPWHAHKLASWLRVLNALAEKASGLRFMRMGWSDHQPGSLGKNVQFVQALAKIKQVETLVIAGYYAKNWPSYLRKEMGVQVHAVCDLNTEPSKYVAEESYWISRLEENNLNIFLKKLEVFQEGTENLMP